jgi:transposase
MARPPQVAPEKKIRIVLAVIAGEVKVSEAARKEGVSEASIHKWKNEFLEAGRQALAAGGRSGPSGREAQLEAEVADLTQALGEAAVELRVWKKSAEARLGPSRTLR